MSSSEAAIRKGIVPCEHVFGKGMRSGPRVVAGVADDAGPDRVVQDIGDRALELLLGVDDPRREARAEEVSPPLMAFVEAQRVHAVEVLDPVGHVGPRHVEDEVDVVAHQAVGVARPGVPRDRAGEESEVGTTIVVVPERARPVDAAGGDMEVPVRNVRAEDAGHPSRLRRERGPAARCGRTVTASAHLSCPAQPGPGV
jgi:hypothetical protein